MTANRGKVDELQKQLDDVNIRLDRAQRDYQYGLEMALEASVLRDAGTLNALGAAYLSLGQIDRALATLRLAPGASAAMCTTAWSSRVSASRSLS